MQTIWQTQVVTNRVESCVSVIHTWPTGHVIFRHNLYECRPIFKIISLTGAPTKPIYVIETETSTSRSLSCYTTLGNLRQLLWLRHFPAVFIGLRHIEHGRLSICSGKFCRISFCPVSAPNIPDLQSRMLGQKLKGLFFLLKHDVYIANLGEIIIYRHEYSIVVVVTAPPWPCVSVRLQISEKRGRFLVLVRWRRVTLCASVLWMTSCFYTFVHGRL